MHKIIQALILLLAAFYVNKSWFAADFRPVVAEPAVTPCPAEK